MGNFIKIISISAILTPMVVAGSIDSCKGCHGADFGKVALGKSKIVKDMSRDEIVSTLKGYRDGTYGGSMKGVMVKAVKSLSDKEIENMADEIMK